MSSVEFEILHGELTFVILTNFGLLQRCELLKVKYTTMRLCLHALSCLLHYMTVTACNAHKCAMLGATVHCKRCFASRRRQPANRAWFLPSISLPSWTRFFCIRKMAAPLRSFCFLQQHRKWQQSRDLLNVAGVTLSVRQENILLS